MSEIIRIFRFKLLQIYRVKQTRDYFYSKKKLVSLKNEKRYPFIKINYVCVDFTHSMLISRFFDNDPNSFSVKNIIEKLGMDKKIDLNSYFATNKNAIKALTVWRGNVFAHDNFNVALSSIACTNDDIFPSHLLDFYFKDLMDMLINIYLECECLNDPQKNKEQLTKELFSEIDTRKAQYEKSLENIFI